jgi:hypothetical protein
MLNAIRNATLLAQNFRIFIWPFELLSDKLPLKGLILSSVDQPLSLGFMVSCALVLLMQSTRSKTIKIE